MSLFHKDAGAKEGVGEGIHIGRGGMRGNQGAGKDEREKKATPEEGAIRCLHLLTGFIKTTYPLWATDEGEWESDSCQHPLSPGLTSCSIHL